MPEIFRQEGFRFRIYLEDHPPAHVHIIKGDGELVLNLLDPFSKESIRIWKMKNQDIKRAFNLMTENRERLLAAWREIHG